MSWATIVVMLSVGGALGACGTGPTTAPDAALAPVRVEAEPAVTTRPSWLGPDVAPLSRWRLVSDEDRTWAIDPVLGFTWALAWDAQFAFVHTDRGVLVRSKADGIVGFMPAALAFVAIVDGVVIATRDGVSLQAPAAHATELAAYTIVDASRRMLDVEGHERVALEAQGLVRSRDGGATWRAIPRAPADIGDARVRPDGTLVVRAATSWVIVTSDDHVQPTGLMPYASERSLVRYGGWIVSGRPSDLARISAQALVLAADRRRWGQVPLPDAIVNIGFVQIVDNWLGFTATPADERWPDPPPHIPPRLPARPPGEAPSQKDVASVIGAGPGLATPPCHGPRCLASRLPSLPGSQRVARFFDDALCTARDACEPLLRAPMIGIFDRDTQATRVLRAPATCVPEKLESARGLVLLVCRDSVSALTSTGWGDTLALPTRPGTSRQLAMADDGTLALSLVGRDTFPQAAWIRSPVELGVADAWREITRADMLWLAPLPGGRAVVASAPTDTALELVVVDRDASAPSAPPTVVPVTGRLDQIALEGAVVSVKIDGVTRPVLTIRMGL